MQWLGTVSEVGPSQVNLVLDMDGTLIDNMGRGNVRPYLYEFMLFCFEHFATVSLWTAALPSWFDVVQDVILQPVLDRVSATLGRECKFHFIYTRSRCILGEFGFVKPLRKIWNAKTIYPTFSKDNTIIIDDSVKSYMRNYGNAIPIVPYNGGPDYELVKAKFFLSDLISHFNTNNTVRNMDKQFWFYNPDYTHFSQLTIVIWKTYKKKNADSGTSSTLNIFEIIES